MGFLAIRSNTYCTRESVMGFLAICRVTNCNRETAMAASLLQLVASLLQLMALKDGQEPHDGLSGAVGVAADGQEPHGGFPGAVGVAAVGQEPHGGFPVAVGVPADGQEPHGATLLQSVALLMARNPMKACLLYTSPSPRDLSTSRMPSSA